MDLSHLPRGEYTVGWMNDEEPPIIGVPRARFVNQHDVFGTPGLTMMSE
jgi:hypothetical protein